MPITIRDSTATRIGRVVPNLGSLTAHAAGTMTAPAGRSGRLLPHPGALVTSIRGQFSQPAIVRSGKVIPALGALTPSMRGTFQVAGARNGRIQRTLGTLSDSLRGTFVAPVVGTNPLPTGLMLEDFSHGFRSCGTANPSNRVIYGYWGAPKANVNIVADTSAPFLPSGNTHALQYSGVNPSGSGYDPRIQLYSPDTAMEAVAGWSNTRYWLKRFVNNPPPNTRAQANSNGWVDQFYNRLRVWVKVPSGYSVPLNPTNPGYHSVEWGTFLKPNESGFESDVDNNHYYHTFSTPSSGGLWQHVIIDTHPQHRRGPSTEVGVIGNPYSGLGYFDCMCAMYCDFLQGAQAGIHSLRALEFYRDTDDTSRIATLNGLFRGSDRWLYVGWNQNEFDSNTCTVKYSYSDIRTIGWNAATTVGTATPDGSQYSDVKFSNTGTVAAPGANQWIYVAVKPNDVSDLTKFRQIILPVQ